jgi:cell division protein FtsB
MLAAAIGTGRGIVTIPATIAIMAFFVPISQWLPLKCACEKEQTMSVGDDVKRRVRSVVAPSIFLAITAYFAWNATQGDRGLVAFAERKNLLRQVTEDLNKAQAERDALQVRVNGLQTRHLDPDTLDERARMMLNLGDPSDVIVKLPPQDRLW